MEKKGGRVLEGRGEKGEEIKGWRGVEVEGIKERKEGGGLGRRGKGRIE